MLKHHLTLIIKVDFLLTTRAMRAKNSAVALEILMKCEGQIANSEWISDTPCSLFAARYSLRPTCLISGKNTASNPIAGRNEQT